MLYSLYEPLVRPCLFTMDPEKAHVLTMNMMRFAGSVPLFTRMISQQVESRPRKVMGLEFPNPADGKIMHIGLDNF